jgi:hypothetical protein
MKNYRILVLLFFLGCHNYNSNIERSDRQKWGYDHWQQNFKDQVLCDCILAGSGDKKFESQIKLTDKSFSSPINFILFDSLSKVTIQPVIFKMKADSIASVKTVSEAMAGKKIFNTCLQFYKSRKLDSIARAASIKWSQISNIDSLVMRKIPSY